MFSQKLEMDFHINKEHKIFKTDASEEAWQICELRFNSKSKPKSQLELHDLAPEIEELNTEYLSDS